jgi:hypothetical protein
LSIIGIEAAFSARVGNDRRGHTATANDAAAAPKKSCCWCDASLVAGSSDRRWASWFLN